MKLIYNQSGFALPLVLGITTMLTIIIITISASVSRKIAVVSEFRDRCRADLSVYSGMNETLFNLLTATFTYAGLNLHAVDRGESLAASLQRDSASAFWNLYGDPISLGNGVRLTLRDTAGMISPMAYKSELLRRLLDHARPGAGGLVDVIADWQDKDEFKRLKGAEEWEYRQADLPYAPRNARVAAVSELLLLQGFDREIFEKIKEDLIYWPVSVNYLTMSSNMFRAFFDDDALVDQLLALRRETRLTPALFTALTGIRQTIDAPMMPSGKIKVTVTAEVEKARSTIEAVVSKKETTDQPFTILGWRR